MSPIDALEGGLARVETKGRLRRFVNDFVFANRKLTGHNRRGHLFLLSNSHLCEAFGGFRNDIAEIDSFSSLPEPVTHWAERLEDVCGTNHAA